MALGKLEALHRRVVDCRRCPRLVAYREEVAQRKRAAHRHEPYWGRPVPGWGDPQARLLVVGLAPAAHGANRTGRMFTGDGPYGAGNFLMAALHRAGLANQPFSCSQDDGLSLYGVYLTAVVRCAPPGHRPTPEEIQRCIPYLAEELEMLQQVQAIVALGRLAFAGTVVVASYHPSRQNTQTGRLTPQMLDDVLALAQRWANKKGAEPRPLSRTL